ncbi:MAG: hypothetical protein N2484_00585 [Clostridia bacterium]|nr:hypothetical protein [Clostridia bacterium]
MIKRIYHSKIFVLFLSMILVGFLIGYTYSVLTSRPPRDTLVNTSESNKQESREEGVKIPAQEDADRVIPE